MTAGTINDCQLDEWRCSDPLGPQEHQRICREMALDGFKWDGQVGDVTSLAPFAIVIPQAVWRNLAAMAEALSRELVAAETELAQRPDLWRRLGLPWRVRDALSGSDSWTPAAARVIRFDFHPTATGWRVSEANSDVPGGYAEATVFTRAMAEHSVRAAPAGDPTAMLCDALAAQARKHGRIALLSAAGYLEDFQVAAHLAAAIRRRGLNTACIKPEQLEWRDGLAQVDDEPIDVIFRFYQGEWMTRIPGRAWRAMFRGGSTPICNPAVAVLSESKRLGMLLDELDTPMPTWREIVATTATIHAAWSKPTHDWVLKRAYSNNGEAVIGRAWSPPADYALTLAHGLVAPNQWAAQRHFETLRLTTPAGPMYPCLGVYVVNGEAGGIYGRLSPQPVIDFRAIDTAILVKETPC